MFNHKNDSYFGGKKKERIIVSSCQMYDETREKTNVHNYRYFGEKRNKYFQKKNQKSFPTKLFNLSEFKNHSYNVYRPFLKKKNFKY